MQEITRVNLMKINEQFGVDDVQLLSCPTSQRTLCSNGRVSLDRGRDPGYEFVFTLSNAVDGDAGPYEVVVEVKHPSTGSITQLKKRFRLEGIVPLFFLAYTLHNTFPFVHTDSNN